MIAITATIFVRDIPEDLSSIHQSVEYFVVIEMVAEDEPSTPTSFATAQNVWEGFPSRVEGFGWSRNLFLEFGEIFHGIAEDDASLQAEATRISE